MKSKHWLIALSIICFLALAFFWGGDNHQHHTGSEQESNQAFTIKNTENSKTEKVQPKQKSKGYTDTENSEARVKASYLDTKSANEILPDKASKADKTEKTYVTNKIKEKSLQKTNKSVAEKLAKGKTEATGKKDKYLTDPVPKGKPKPVEWQEMQVNKNKKLACTLSVSCKTILDNMDKFNNNKLEVLPEDGIIFKSRAVNFYDGESVFDVLLREMKKSKIHMEFEMTPIYNSNYIEGIHNLYEFDCGELSGWMYRVNGWFPNYGCSRFKLKDGDCVEWIYTCDLGRDIGGGAAAGGKN